MNLDRGVCGSTFKYNKIMRGLVLVKAMSNISQFTIASRYYKTLFDMVIAYICSPVVGYKTIIDDSNVQINRSRHFCRYVYVILPSYT